MTDVLKRTPLYEEHQSLGGKLVPFAGWELPVRYSGIIDEHQAVRTAAGIFDVSHMGEILVTGKEAEKALNFLSCNDVATLYDGKALYSAILNENGGVVDDIIIYRYSKEHYLICVNASNADKDFAWLTEHNKFSAKFENVSNSYGQIALQGPKAEAILSAACSREGLNAEIIESLKYFHFVQLTLGGANLVIARTGYTGEDGFELFIPAEQTQKIWRLLLEVGAAHGLVPCGLGARDSLRLEAAYPLHGHELSEDVSALESGLGWIVKFKKADFIGRAALNKIQEQGVPRKLVGFFVQDQGVVREQTPLHVGAEVVGLVTSGTKTPSLPLPLGLARVASRYAEPGTVLRAIVRNRELRCSVTKLPFYKSVLKSGG